MRIAILSCFYPYRGGIAQFNASLYGQLGKTNTIKAFNFKRQYPGFLFPGKTQYVTKDDEAVPVESEAVLDTVNPFTWRKTFRKIRDWNPDLVIICYWMSWFAPSLGYVARRLKKEFKTISILHNVIPHEPRFFDKPLTKYYLGGFDGHVVLSGEVKRDLLSLCPGARAVELFHPIYDHFGSRVPREEAEDRLSLQHGKKNILFFGLIREYKGLDILLEAFGSLGDEYQLIVAGEPYGSFKKYQDIIDSSPAKDRIHLYLNYIKDSEVKYFFSAADVTVLPYRSATQSGINAISCNFDVPMIVTDVGGLKESVEEAGTGLVAASPEPGLILEEILKFFSDESLREQFHVCILGEKERLSWYSFCKRLLNFADNLNRKS